MTAFTSSGMEFSCFTFSSFNLDSASFLNLLFIFTTSVQLNLFFLEEFLDIPFPLSQIFLHLLPFRNIQTGTDIPFERIVRIIQGLPLIDDPSKLTIMMFQPEFHSED